MDISVSNSKNVIDYFLSLAKKYGWGRLEFMVGTCDGTKDISRKVDHIQIAYMYHQAHGYFVLLDIGNIGNQGLPNPLIVSVLKNYPTYALLCE